MHVQQVEILAVRHHGHLRRQSEIVRLMLEQRIRQHLDFVKSHALVQFGEPRGQR